MTTVLLSGDARSPDVSICRCSRASVLMAHVRAARLDRLLADGASPDAGVLLSLRAARLISGRHRRRLADTLRGLLADAQRPVHPFDPPVPLARHEIAQARDLVGEVVTILEDGGPVDARGVAHVEILLREGNSPFYAGDPSGTLRSVLQRALVMLVVHDAITTPGP